MANNDKSFIKLNRRITQWEWFQDGNVLKVWVYILANCNWKDKEWHGITVEKGSFITSQKAICNACDLSRQQVRSVLAKLEKTQEITKKSTKHLTNGYTLIKVNNWAFYQDDEEENNQSSNHKITNEQPMDNQTITITKKEKKEKKEKNINIYAQEFEILWSKYPRKQGKQKAFASYQKSRNKYTYEQIEEGLDKYVLYVSNNKIETQYIKFGSTWFNQECWNDDYVIFEEKKNSKPDIAPVYENNNNLEISDEDYEKYVKILETRKHE